MMLEDRHIDQLEFLRVAASLPQALPQLDATAPGRREAGIRHVFIDPIAIGNVVVVLNKRCPDRVKQIRRDAVVIKDRIHNIDKAVALVVGIGVDKGIGIVEEVSHLRLPRP